MATATAPLHLRTYILPRVHRLSAWTPLAAATASGILLGLTGLPRQSSVLAPLAWIWMVPLLWSGVSGWRLFWCAWWSGILSTAIATYAMMPLLGKLAIPYYPLGGLALALPWAVYALLRRRVGIWAIPFIWPLSEWLVWRLDGIPPFLFPPLSQANAVWLIQFADLFGAWGISAWLALFNLLIWRALHHPQPKRWLAAALCLAAPLAYSAFRLYEKQPDPCYRVLLMQSTPTPGMADRLRQATDAAILSGGKPDLIVWPETVLPRPLDTDAGERRFAAEAVADWGTPLLTGGFWERGRRALPLPGVRRAPAGNATWFLTPGPPYSGADAVSLQRPHIKRRLVPFVEGLPYTGQFAWLDRFYRHWRPDLLALRPGRDFQVFRYLDDRARPITIGPAICWEELYGDDIAETVRRGAQVLAVVTSTSQFGDSPIPYLHASFSRLRAIENRRPVVRAGVGGLTTALDAQGRVLAVAPPLRDAVLSATVAPISETTMYTRYPNFLPVACAVLLAAALVQSRFRRMA